MQTNIVGDLRCEILNFLKDFKELMGEGRYYIKDRAKNLQALNDLGINSKIQNNMILSISLENYAAGPKPDQLHGGNYFEFGKFLDNIEIYIKLKIISYRDGEEQAVCYSFHPSEYSLNYPFRYKRK